MSGALQAVFQNQRSFGLAIGAAFGGGFFAGQISTAGNGVADYNLVVGPESSARSYGQWKTSQTSTTGTSSVIDGPTNSSNMNDASHPAAQFCEAVTAGGFSDWYMPARNELEVCYYNLKASTANNTTAFGVNANAVPARTSNYTTGIPTQTSATDFREGNAESFGSFDFWSSTEQSSTRAWMMDTGGGYQYNQTKTSGGRVRAVRRVAV